MWTAELEAPQPRAGAAESPDAEHSSQATLAWPSRVDSSAADAPPHSAAQEGGSTSAGTRLPAQPALPAPLSSRQRQPQRQSAAVPGLRASMWTMVWVRPKAARAAREAASEVAAEKLPPQVAAAVAAAAEVVVVAVAVAAAKVAGPEYPPSVTPAASVSRHLRRTGRPRKLDPPRRAPQSRARLWAPVSLAAAHEQAPVAGL